MMSRILHGLAGSPAAKYVVLNFPPARWASRRFVAGETLDQAMTALAELHKRGLFGMLDQLGESVHVEADARRAAEDYLEGIGRIRASGLPANVSLKLTQMGLDVAEELCLENLRAVVSAAHQAGVFVEFDMESSAYTDRTLAIHRRLHGEFPNVGVCVQSYLHRTIRDAEALIDMGARVRLVKGAYLEPPEIAYADKADVDAAYLRLLEMFFSEKAVAAGVHCGVASHDPKLIDKTLELVKARGLPADKFEFQMLYGIARDLQARLAAEKRRVRVYVTYGSQWYPYFMRRLAERPANLLFVLRHMVGG
jgi:proline dehydrogenase